MTTLFRRSTLLAVLVGSAALMTIAAPQAHGASYRSCKLSEREQQPSGGKPTYNLSVKTQGSSCTTAKRVARGFHSCRSRTSFRCTKRVLGRWTCQGSRTSRTAVMFYGSFTCKAGSQRVRSTYQQNT